MTGGVVPIMNLPGIKPGQIKLTGPILAAIYLGQIKKWNDPQIAAINTGVPLPNLPITVVHRSDGSGTTFIFTVLSVDEERGMEVEGRRRHRGQLADRPGRQGQRRRRRLRQADDRLDRLRRIRLRLQNHMTYALMQNKSGTFVPPDAADLPAAAAGVDWTAASKNGYDVLLLDEPGADVLADQRRDLRPDPQAAGRCRRRARRCWRSSTGRYKNGDAAAAGLDYVPLPAKAKALIRKTWLEVIGPDGKPVYVSH